ncbi:MAG: carboxymuconolactone decarboxylase family protein [Congregibacter sp.]
MINIPAQLTTLQPATSSAFRRTASQVLPFSDPTLLTLCREQLLATQQRRTVPSHADHGPIETAVLRLAEQFAVNVDGISEDDIAVLTRALGKDVLNALVNAIYLMDAALRLEQVVPVVLPDADGTATPLAAGVSDSSSEVEQMEDVISTSIADFAATAVLADEVDIITGEMVRLRCAQIHNCRLCGSLRQRRALDEGLDEDMVERVSRYEQGGVREDVVAALHLVDTLIMLPADANAALRVELHKHYSPTQIAELCFDVVKWSQQKALVATQVDAAPWEGIHVLDFGEDGHPVFSGPLQQAG